MSNQTWKIGDCQDLMREMEPDSVDPFLGSGTALEAGYLIGRDVLGFDISDEWEHLYTARAHRYQGNLGDWI